MTLKSELLRLTEALQKAQIPHALIGGLAVGFSGIARFTNDIDFLIDESDRLRTVQELTALGYKVWKENPEFVQMDGPTPVDLMIARRPLSRSMIAHARILPGIKVPCVTIEDLVGLKIQSFATNRQRQHKDKADIQALASVHRLDNDKIKRYADLFEVWDEVLVLLKKDKE